MRHNKAHLQFPALPGYSPGVIHGLGIIATGDLNGDGRDDVVTSTEYPGVVAMLGQADGSLGPPQTIGPGADSIVVGDVNGDGFADIVTAVFSGQGTLLLCA